MEQTDRLAASILDLDDEKKAGFMIFRDRESPRVGRDNGKIWVGQMPDPYH